MAYTRAGAECVCGKTHRLSPTAQAAVITAFTRGHLHRMTKDGIVPVCILVTFEHRDVMELYDGRQISYG